MHEDGRAVSLGIGGGVPPVVVLERIGDAQRRIGELTHHVAGGGCARAPD
jgi:hypothetical protein